MPPPFGPFPFGWFFLIICIGAMVWCCSASKERNVERQLEGIKKKLSEIENLLKEKR
ncbi:hypothetical protein [Desulfurobacterium sp.]